MKKLVALILSLAMLLMLTACGEDALEMAEIIKVNSTQSCDTYVPGEDYQQNWNTWGSNEAKLFTMSEQGCYFYSFYGSRLLYFFDYSSGSTVPLCNLPNCAHNSESCNAYLDFVPSYLQYYDGNLYAVCHDGEDSDVTLYRISADGIKIGCVGTIFRLTGAESVVCLIHRGYAYATVYTNDFSERSTEVYRLSLSGGDEAECIRSFDPCFGGACYLRAYGNYVYIEQQYYADGEGNGYNGNIYRYNIHTGTTELVLENVRRDFVVDSEYIYYDNDTQVVAYELITGEKTVLLDLGYPVFLTYDGIHLYCDNDCGLWISQYSGEEAIDDPRMIIVINASSQKPVASISVEENSGSQCDVVGIAQSDLITCVNYKTFYRSDLNAAMSGMELVFEQLN